MICRLGDHNIFFIVYLYKDSFQVQFFNRSMDFLILLRYTLWSYETLIVYCFPIRHSTFLFHEHSRSNIKFSSSFIQWYYDFFVVQVINNLSWLLWWLVYLVILGIPSNKIFFPSFYTLRIKVSCSSFSSFSSFCSNSDL